MNAQTVIALRLQRQHLACKASSGEYDALYRDLQPGQNVYWNGFGQPPELTFRAGFDDAEYNRLRQADRRLIKGRFAGGNLGWIMAEDIELFAALYRKPLPADADAHMRIMELIRQLGPLNIQQIKEETGLLVKQITPLLHRLQEAFMIYEDQYDGEWDRAWYRFEEMFPDCDLERFTRREALKTVLLRYAYRMAAFSADMAKAFYRLPGKEISAAIAELVREGALVQTAFGLMRAEDATLPDGCAEVPVSVFAMHRNDVLVKSLEPELKARFGALCEGLEYDHDALQYLLIDGEFRGVSVGHFRNGPYDLNDVVCDLPGAEKRREEIVEAIAQVNFGHKPARFMGAPL